MLFRVVHTYREPSGLIKLLQQALFNLQMQAFTVYRESFSAENWKQSNLMSVVQIWRVSPTVSLLEQVLFPSL